MQKPKIIEATLDIQLHHNNFRVYDVLPDKKRDIEINDQMQPSLTDTTMSGSWLRDLHPFVEIRMSVEGAQPLATHVLTVTIRDHETGTTVTEVKEIKTDAKGYGTTGIFFMKTEETEEPT